MLYTSHLDIGYPNSTIQTDLNLTASTGEMICILGINGCGKSTLLRTLSGVQPAIKGEVYLGEKDCQKITDLSASQRAQMLSLVLTERMSVENTTVHDIVAMGRYPYTSFLGGLQKTDEDIIEAALVATDIVHYRDVFFNCLSDGEKQRVLIAKALAQQTPVILLDEPTAHLDLPNRINTLLLLRQMAHEQDKTIIISTHELDLALQTADIIWLMSPEKGVEVGKADELVTSGAFERTFTNSNFFFHNENGRLRIVLKKLS